VWFIQNRKNHIRHSGESRKPVILMGSGYRIKSGMTVYNVCTKPLFLNAVTLSAHKRKKKQLIKLDSGIFNSSKTFWKYIPENTFLSIF
ncbi:MAG: hypothetical protein KKA35_11050, partial [Proteobacteria bacterium]|nr:hypothetical protein [Pseudomonadota bacterium]